MINTQIITHGVARCVMFFTLCSAHTIASGPCVAQEASLAYEVNPFVGASTNTEAAGAYHGLGKTFPGATTPFGMAQVSPQTILGGDNGSGYSYEHTHIEGFSMTQMSGIGWNGEMGNFLVMPTTGPLRTFAGRDGCSVPGWRSAYDKATERAHAGYYAVRLSDTHIYAEATAAPHCGMLRMTFPANPCSRVLIDLARRVGGTASRQYVHVIDAQTLEGWIDCQPESGGWGNGEGQVKYRLFFHARFNKPMSRFGFFSATLPPGMKGNNDDVVSAAYIQAVASAQQKSVDFANKKSCEIEGRHIGVYAETATLDGERIEMSVGLSYVDIDGARLNFNAEVANRSFDEVHRATIDQWNKKLGCIAVQGGTDEERKVFYTSLYHTMIDPRVCQDVDGRYVGGDYQVHTTDGTFSKRTVFSGWDVFRSQMPLQTLINPTLVNDLLNSLITMATQSGRQYFERWELLNAYSGCMLGNPAISVLSDAYAKGIRQYNVALAYQYAKNTSARFGNDQYGYTPGSLCLSYTLEYAYTDWCLSRMAHLLGHKADALAYAKKAQAYRNIFDKEKGWFRPRDEKGAWLPWPEEGRLKEWYGCIECNPLQQGWFVPHDVDGMVTLMGGKRKVIADLDSMFQNTPKQMLWNAYYNHANEPVHFVPYLYNRLGQPWKTQYHTRYICRNAYHNKVEGLVGNEDVGQMSAWYVLSAIGLHQYCPGDTRFEITSPLFRHITVRLGNGSTLIIEAPNNSHKAIYIKRALWNGKPISPHIDYHSLMKGGTLHLEMSETHP